MGLLDGPMGALAQTLVGKFGRSATITRPGTTTRNPADGGVVVVSEAVAVSCEVVLEEFDERQVDGTLVQVGDRKAIVSRARMETDGGSGFVPQPNRDTLTESGNNWRILRVLGYPSGSQEAAFTLHVRRGPVAG